MSSLGSSIKNFESAAKVLLNSWIWPKKYSEELTTAAKWNLKQLW
jgi:hypothetical protein